MYKNRKIGMKLLLFYVMASMVIGGSVPSDFAREVAKGIFLKINIYMVEMTLLYLMLKH